jgi:hypothetical protein
LLDDPDNLVDESKDIMVIKGSKDKPISFNDVIKVFEKMKDQFKELDEKGLDRSYGYEGLSFNKKTNTYEMSYGT